MASRRVICPPPRSQDEVLIKLPEVASTALPPRDAAKTNKARGELEGGCRESDGECLPSFDRSPPLSRNRNEIARLRSPPPPPASFLSIPLRLLQSGNPFGGRTRHWSEAAGTMGSSANWRERGAIRTPRLSRLSRRPARCHKQICTLLVLPAVALDFPLPFVCTSCLDSSSSTNNNSLLARPPTH